MTTCQHEKCKALATHSVLTRLPAKGWPMTVATINIYLGITACFKHALDLATEGILFPPDSQQRLTASIEAQGRAAPDFARAEFDVITLNDPGYLNYLQLSANKPN